MSVSAVLIILFVVTIGCGLVYWARYRPEPPQQPISPDVLLDLARISARRRAHLAKMEMRRNSEYAKRMALRNMRGHSQ